MTPGPWRWGRTAGRAICGPDDKLIGVMDREDDARAAALVPEMVEFIRSCATNWDCDVDAHRHGTHCRTCDASALLDRIDGKDPR